MNISSRIIKQYDYRPQKWQTLALFILAFAGMVILSYFAIWLDRPINVRGVSD